jgi:hypothetical protein
MNEGTTISYPARPSQFLALLEQLERLGDWEVNTLTYTDRCYVGFSPRSSARSSKKHERECLIYNGTKAPVVHLDKLSFDLLRLFEKGEPWDPQVYTANPYMPDTAKRFLNQLFAVLVSVKPALPQAA